MARIVLTDGSGRWFDSKSAQSWDEETSWDGRNHVSKATGDQFLHERLYRTKGGIYVIHAWSQWQGSTESYEETSAENAARWLSQNDYLEGDAAEAGAQVQEAYAALEIP